MIYESDTSVFISFSRCFEVVYVSEFAVSQCFEAWLFIYAIKISLPLCLCHCAI